MDNLASGAVELISKQIAIVRQLQDSIIEALGRNDSGTAQRLIESCDKAFGTFTDGVRAMSIDVSNLKNVLKAGAVHADAIQSLSDRLNQVEQTLQQLDPNALTNLQTDVGDIKVALKELNDSTVSIKTPTIKKI